MTHILKLLFSQELIVKRKTSQPYYIRRILGKELLVDVSDRLLLAAIQWRQYYWSNLDN